jgi:FkbM family methyltransferase
MDEKSKLKPLMTLAAWSARILPASLKRRLYRSPALARILRGTLNRSAPPGTSEVSVAAGELQGARLVLNLQEEKDYWLGTYETELQAAVRDFVRPGMIAYDVGANIGYISLMLARQVGLAGCVFAFEALPSNLERLRLNLSLNSGFGRVEAVQAAVVEKSHPVQFLVGPSGGMGKAQGSAGRREYSYSESVQVDGVSLDDFAFTKGNPVPQVVKMDIEGGEVLALPGMQRVLEEGRPLVFLELHGPESAKCAWEVFTRSGYTLRAMTKEYPQIASLESLDWKSYLVAVPEDKPRDR